MVTLPICGTMADAVYRVKAARISRVAGVLVLFLATVLLAAGTFMPGFLDTKLQEGILNAVIWQQNSPLATHERYTDTDPNTDKQNIVHFYMFNITNLEEVRAGGKPVLEEIGPYIYQRIRRRYDVWFTREGIVSFTDHTYYLPMPGGADPEDRITTLNLPLVGVMETIHAHLSGPAAHHLAELLAHMIESWHSPEVQGMFTTRTVAEMLFGYDDPLLTAVTSLLPGLRETGGRVELITNGTSVEESRARTPTHIDSGLRDQTRLGATVRWHDVTSVQWNNHTEPVQGVFDAAQFPPGLAVGDELEIWVGELFRSARLKCNETVALQGVELLRCQVDEAQAEPDARYYQYIRGLFNVTSLRATGPRGPANAVGVPLFMSAPHFCGADAALTEALRGVRCDIDRHRLFLDVEPTTGATMRGAKRMMLSSQYKDAYQTVDPNLSDTILPIFWAEEVGTATKADIKAFKDSVGTIRGLIVNLHVFPFSFGLPCIALAVGMLILPMLPIFHTIRSPSPPPYRSDTAPNSAARSVSNASSRGPDRLGAAPWANRAPTTPRADDALTEALLQAHDQGAAANRGRTSDASSTSLASRSERVSQLPISRDASLSPVPV